MAEFVAGQYGMTLEQLKAKTRCWNVARPRQVAMWAMRRLCPHLSYPAIASVLGLSDHTTILHGDRRIEALRKTDWDMQRAIDSTLQHFEGAPSDDAYVVMCWARDLPVAA